MKRLRRYAFARSYLVLLHDADVLAPPLAAVLVLLRRGAAFGLLLRLRVDRPRACVTGGAAVRGRTSSALNGPGRISMSIIRRKSMLLSCEILRCRAAARVSEQRRRSAAAKAHHHSSPAEARPT